MNRTADLSLEDFKRLPGLYRRWELAGLLNPGEYYHLEDAGRASDGSPLVAVYRGSNPETEVRE